MHQTFEDVLKLDGKAFIEALLKFEQDRFDRDFLKGSVYEQINAEFGIFPAKKVYPVYFAGDIFNPKDKLVFIGINPGYNEKHNLAEQLYLEKAGLAKGYGEMFKYFKNKKQTLWIKYYSSTAKFLEKLYGIKKIDWDWYQNNFINLDMIPYHSVNTNGLRINNPALFRKVHFEILLKMLRHLNPTRPVFIAGFPTFEKYLNQSHFENVITFKKHSNFCTGKIDGKYEFIGLPFLTWVKGGQDALVENIKSTESIH